MIGAPTDSITLGLVMEFANAIREGDGKRVF